MTEDILRNAKQLEISLTIMESMVSEFDSLSDQELSEVHAVVKRVGNQDLLKACEASWTLRNLQFAGWLRRVHQLTDEQLQALQQDAEKWRQWREAFERERLSK